MEKHCIDKKYYAVYFYNVNNMKWIKITEENKPDANTKIAFLTDHILFPDNTYFGIRSDVTNNYYSNGQTFEKDMVTHYFYVEANGALAK